MRLSSEDHHVMPAQAGIDAAHQPRLSIG